MSDRDIEDPNFHIRRHREQPRDEPPAVPGEGQDTGQEQASPARAAASAKDGAGHAAARSAAHTPTPRSKLSEAALGDGYYAEVSGRRQNPVSRLVTHWVDRVTGAAAQRSFAEQEAEYASGRTKRDYVCNTVGTMLWGAVFPLLTIVTTQLVGAEQAGMFSLVFVTATLLMFVANYGVRTFQVSDTREEHSFADYQLNRVLTCIIMMVAGYVYCTVRGYTADVFTISMGVYTYRMIDALADVYEGRLQQADKMYLAGLSQALRSAFVFIVFTAVLFVTRSLVVSSIFMAAAAVASLVVLTLPLAYMETPKSRKLRGGNVVDLFQRCFPLFVALFLYNLIDNMPKFMMEGVLTYDNQLFFNAIYFPAHAILLIVSMVYKPLLLRLANAWESPDGRRQFNLILGAVLGCVVGVTVFMLVFMGWVGVPIMSFMYGVDFEPFRIPLYIMIVAGGITAAIDFLCQVITVQRKQNKIMKLYVVTFAVSVVSSFALIHLFGLLGAVAAYAIEMAVLLVLMVLQITNIRARAMEKSRARRAEGVGQSWY